jgi:cell wall assembly regulator SMI1
MSGTKLTTVQKEKDLGVTFDSSLKCSKHIHNCASKANQILGLIKRSFKYIDQDMFHQAYT